MEIVEQKQYREDLLEWCNNIYFHWESIKPRFSKLFDLKSLEEWEMSYLELKEKLNTDLKVDFDDYQTAKNLYEQWELLHEESQGYREEVESDVRNIAEVPSDFDKGTVMLSQKNDTVEELDKEWVELIQMVINLGIPIQEIRNFVSDYKG
ncbi:anti-repressor SinI family protein [Metabacillus bambusae]|nr:anti-repressor SinI family protein [Metabacillus bambusae]